MISEITENVNKITSTFNSLSSICNKDGESQTKKNLKQMVEDVNHYEWLDKLSSDDYDAVYQANSCFRGSLMSFKSSCKRIPKNMENVPYFISILLSETKKIDTKTYDKAYVERRANQKAQEEEEKRAFEEAVANAKPELTIEWLKEHKEDAEYIAFCKALESDIGEGNVSYGIIRGILWESKNGYISMETPSPSECDVIKKTCDRLGIKQFAMTGYCSSLIECLIKFQNMGCTFHFEYFKVSEYHHENARCIVTFQ